MENIYDRAIKEIIEPSLYPLAYLILGLNIEHVTELKDKIQVTLEREGDHLKLLVFIDQELNCILHLEFHVKDEAIGILMLLKKGMLVLKFELPVKQYVIYLGSKKKLRNLKNIYKDECTEHKFEVVMLNSIPWRKLLETNVPEVVSLAILGNFGKEKPAVVVAEILKKLDQLVGGQPGAERHVRRLEVFSNLRNLQRLIIQTSSKMAWTYDIKSDLRYQQGREEGKEEGIEVGIEKGMEKGMEEGIRLGAEKKATVFVENLLLDGEFSDEKIATLAAVRLEFVKKVRKRLEKQGKLLARKSSNGKLNGH